ncbi:MAG: hypothetical protein IJ426_03535 [Clostridia bacterium]|nr:hypothetical protein [Clostridia bacterium]
MNAADIKITHEILTDEDGVSIISYGLLIDGIVYPDLTTSLDRITNFASLIKDDVPSGQVLFELFEDYLF